MIKDANINLNISTGPMKLSLKLNGEYVENAAAKIGYLHRGVEKIFERTSWIGIPTYLERIDYVSPNHATLAYVLGVEKISGIEVSERINSIRRIICELSRIISHLYYLNNIGKALGLSLLSMHSLKEREKLNDLLEMISGARLTYNYIRIGGVSSDITDGFSDKANKVLTALKFKIDEFRENYIENSIVKNRTKGLGVLSITKAIEFGVSGPNLRASGGNFDVRVACPYSGYDKIENEISTSNKFNFKNGDTLDRINYRFYEIEESIKIIKNLLDSVPEGPFLIPTPRIFKPKKGEVYTTVESPRGTLGVFIKSTSEKTPFRIQLRGPSFYALRVAEELCTGLQKEDVSVLMSSFDILVSEVDR